MSKYQNIQKIEINFQEINGGESNLWVYDMLGFIYAQLTDEQVLEMLARSNKTLWEHQQRKLNEVK
jgi:hypothetical protein